MEQQSEQHSGGLDSTGKKNHFSPSGRKATGPEEQQHCEGHQQLFSPFITQDEETAASSATTKGFGPSTF